MLDTSVMSRSPQGPITSPAARNPRIELILSLRNTDTATTAAVRRIATCASEIMNSPQGQSAGRGMNSVSPGTGG